MGAALMMGEAARRCGVETWQAQRVIDRGLYGAVHRLGRIRYILEDELPAFRAALERGGYLPAEASAQVG